VWDQVASQPSAVLYRHRTLFSLDSSALRGGLSAQRELRGKPQQRALLWPESHFFCYSLFCQVGGWGHSQDEPPGGGTVLLGQSHRQTTKSILAYDPQE